MIDPAVLPVYLIHWDAPEWCASAAASVMGSAGVTIDLSVVDNGQTGGPSLADCLPQGVRVLAMPGNRGYTGGANAALADWRERFPEGEFCVLGSHDLHVAVDTLAHLVSVARANPDCGISAPALESPSATSGGIWRGLWSMQVALDGAPEIVDRDWASGTCLLLRRSCTDAVGSFDERLGSYMEDVDYGLRAHDHGWRVLVATTARAHGLGSSIGETLEHRTANTVIINAKRNGLRGACASIVHLSVWIARGCVASIAPWRTTERRSVSWRYARNRSVSLFHLAVSGRLVRVLRDRDHP